MKLCDTPTFADPIIPSVVTLDVRMRWVFTKTATFVGMFGSSFISLISASSQLGFSVYRETVSSFPTTHLRLPGHPRRQTQCGGSVYHTLREFEAEALRMGLEKFQPIEHANWTECFHVNARRYRYSSNHNDTRSVFAGLLGVNVTRLGLKQGVGEMHKWNATFSLVIERASRLMLNMEHGCAAAMEQG